ncbi:exocyst complex component Sec6p [Monosporozyma unispora]|nr:SNARE-binding exocyst subunit S6 [Kazachstania unispora]
MATLPNNVSDLIKDDLSLERINELKENLLKQKSTIEYQLDKESSKYYGHVEESLKMLNISKKSVQSIKDAINEVNKSSLENEEAINRYSIISDATELFETVRTTSSIYDKIFNFDSLLNKLDNLLQEEMDNDSLDTGCPYLLEIHYLLTMARDFQDQMTVMANVSTEDVQRTSRKLFSRISGLVTKFDQLLTGLINDVVEMIRNEQISLVIRLFKIFDLEEREDTKINVMRTVIKTKEIEADKTAVKKLPSGISGLGGNNKNKDVVYPTDQGIYHEIINGTISTRTQSRGYKNFFINNLKDSINSMFINVRETYFGDKAYEVLNNLDWVFNELMIVREHLTKLSPTGWNIFNEYFDVYYHELNVLVNELVESEPETLVLLDILDYDKLFQANLIADFGFTKKTVKSVIGDEQKEKIFTDYLNLIVTKMTEWIANLEKAEFEVFDERNTPPHIDDKGLFYLDGTKTCFQMFTQQVDVASGANQAKILVGVVEKFTGLLLKRQKDWTNKINNEVARLLNFNRVYDLDPQNVPEEDYCPGGLMEYLIAVINDQMRAADYIVAISRKCSALLSKSWIKEVTECSDSALDASADLVKVCCRSITTIMFDDMKGAYTEIFSKAWYTGSHIKQIAATINEFVIDTKPRMSPVVFSSFIGFVIDDCFLNYINALNEKHSFKMKNNKFSDAIKRDFEILFKLFAGVINEDQKAEIIDRRFRFFEIFMDISCEPVDSVMEFWKTMVLEYPETPIDFLEAVLTCRKDVSSSERKHLTQEGLEYLDSSEIKQSLREMVDMGIEPLFVSNFVFESSKWRESD